MRVRFTDANGKRITHYFGAKDTPNNRETAEAKCRVMEAELKLGSLNLTDPKHYIAMPANVIQPEKPKEVLTLADVYRYHLNNGASGKRERTRRDMSLS